MLSFRSLGRAGRMSPIIPLTAVDPQQPQYCLNQTNSISTSLSYVVYPVLVSMKNMRVLQSPASLSMQLRFCASASHNTSSNETALDVAMKVNKLKRMHQSGQGQGRKEIEQMAWKELNTLTELQISTAEGKAVALLLNSWAYFGRYWEKGRDGPFDTNSSSTNSDSSSSDNESKEE
eukprot:Tbor_TRINITY_DN5618_c1_g6::TRINITY_DN5618_c1_g6_i1::g.8473::m.8473